MKSDHANESQQGTVLIAALAIIVVIAGLSLVMLKSTQMNIRSYRQEYREIQTENVADAALSMGVAKLNNDWLQVPAYKSVGSMSAKTFEFHSGDKGYAPIEVPGADLRGHPEKDQFDNDGDGIVVDNPSDNKMVNPASDKVSSGGDYAGGIYRVQVREWVENKGSPKIGAKNIDDDGDGTIDEAGEVSSYTQSDSRKFTLTIEASYGNYTIERRAKINAVQTSADAFALYSENDIEVGNNSYIDSYDSSVGAYGPGNQGGDEANLGAKGDITLGSNADVYGNAQYGGSFNINPNTTLHGTPKTLSSAPSYSTWKLKRNLRPTSGTKNVTTTEKITNNYEKVTVGMGEKAIIPKNTTVTLGNGPGGGGSVLEGNSNGELHIKSQANVFIQGSLEFGSNTDIRIDGPTSPDKDPTKIYVADTFATNPNLDMTITGRVEMKVVDTVDIKPNSEVNVTTDRPPHFSLQVGGTWYDNSGKTEHYSSPGTELNIKPNGTWEGIVQAPAMDNGKPNKPELKLDPNVDFYGAIIGSDVNLKPNQGFHYDESISRSCYLPGVTCSYVSKNPVSWKVSERGSSLSN